MKPDPIVEQVHEARRKVVERFDSDLHAICEDARKRQAASGRKSVQLPARPAPPPVTKAS